jgi:hypothetical protein
MKRVFIDMDNVLVKARADTRRTDRGWKRRTEKGCFEV